MPDDPARAPASGLSLEQLEQQICELAGHIAAATCRWLMLLAEFDDRNGWWGWGTKSCAHWLSWRCSLAPRTAREHLRVAHRLQELPLIRERFASGQLSYCKVRALTRVAAPENERSFVEIACHATGAQVAKLTRGYAGALGATLETAEHAHDYRNLECSWEDDGSLRMSARLPAEDAAVVLAAIKAAEDEAVASGAAPDPTQTIDAHPAGARRADALVSVARSALAAGKAQQPSADPCEFVVHVDVESLTGDRITDRCEVEDGPALAPETARRLGCDAALVRIVEKDGQPMTVSRRKRLISPALRRALRSRDGGCRFPGCDHKRFIHAHHVQHWARGGATTINNLVQLCSFHHRLVHEGGFHVERAGRSSFRFRRPDGRVIDPAGIGRVRGPGLEQQNRACALNIDERTCKPLSAGDPLDYGLAVEILLRRLLGPDPPPRGPG